MSREVRLGLVLYGGVSLAIYMNGVANEFFNAMRGRGIYRLIKVLTDSHVVVDIISGASAGGVNGIFLAYALCNESEFQAFAKLWREQGDVSLLLRDPRKEPDDCHSLFDSKGKYQSYLQGAFDTASPQRPNWSLTSKRWMSSSRAATWKAGCSPPSTISARRLTSKTTASSSN